ncbi:hypothetical protein K788_00028875 [Paraburkholderia caribensis MBA4]|uniref:Uncharacterized protein n=1 Tax=Paraburkholderia caribensis MBA4 TaxID=1323664 RepID=A0A0P0RDZ4_9BURK|nr:hypothetical protein K788_00028875 [Paraburkholderia caribensis MBA4]
MPSGEPFGVPFGVPFGEPFGEPILHRTARASGCKDNDAGAQNSLRARGFVPA